MKNQDSKKEQRKDPGVRSEPLLLGLLYLGYALFLPFVYLNAGMTGAGLAMPGIERALALASGTYYLFLGFSYVSAFSLLFLLWFSCSINRLVVGFMIVAPLGVTHLNRWYALQHFPEVWPS